MKPVIETEKGWTEVIIDGACDFNKFYNIAELLETKFNLTFSNKINGLDTIYWDFDYKYSKLILFYNIYEGTRILSKEFKNATQADNDIVLEISSLLFQQLIDNDWTNFENGESIGIQGSEGGTIIADFENLNGARITLEVECGNIPFAVTFGIYGLMFHTHYEGDLKIAKEYVEQKKFIINQVFDLYNILNEKRDTIWNNKHNKLMDKLIDTVEIQINDEG